MSDHQVAAEEGDAVEPVSLIVAALAAGASAAAKETAGQAVKDAYASLKALLKRLVRDRPLVEDVIEKHEEAPDVWAKPLHDELDKAAVVENEDLVRMAQKLLALVDPVGAQTGKYNVSIHGGKGIVVGDHAHVQMTFEDGD